LFDSKFDNILQKEYLQQKGGQQQQPPRLNNPSPQTEDERMQVGGAAVS
jgi:hypothetical protein